MHLPWRLDSIDFFWRAFPRTNKMEGEVREQEHLILHCALPSRHTPARIDESQTKVSTVTSTSKKLARATRSHRCLSAEVVEMAANRGTGARLHLHVCFFWSRLYGCVVARKAAWIFRKGSSSDTEAKGSSPSVVRRDILLERSDVSTNSP